MPKTDNRQASFGFPDKSRNVNLTFCELRKNRMFFQEKGRKWKHEFSSAELCTYYTAYKAINSYTHSLCCARKVKVKLEPYYFSLGTNKITFSNKIVSAILKSLTGCPQSLCSCVARRGTIYHFILYAMQFIPFRSLIVKSVKLIIMFWTSIGDRLFRD